MAKRGRVHFLTSYIEYLYDQGIKSEEYYVGDASRYIRFLLARATPDDIQAFLATASSPGYRERLAKTVKKFYCFAHERLGLNQAETYIPIDTSNSDGL